MILLIFGLYFADIVTGLKFVFSSALITLSLIAFVYVCYFLVALEEDETDKPIMIFKRFYKKYFAVLIFSALTLIALPSKNTIYITTGLVTGQKVMEQVQNNPLYEKSMKLLEKKIDDALVDVKTEEGKK